MKDLKVNLENLSETERSQLVALIEKANKPVVNSSLLFSNASYWFVGEHQTENHVYRGDHIDNWLFDTGNFFPTEEAAQAHVDYLKARTKVLRYMREREQETGWVADWSDENQAKSYIYVCNSGSLALVNAWTQTAIERSFHSSSDIISEVMYDKELSNCMKTVLNYFQ
jgi:hypothetical protein